MSLNPTRIALTTLATLVASAALAPANAGGQIDDANFPPGFDCGQLGSPKARLECQTFQSNRTSDNNVVPPGTPAIPMPGQSNSTSGPYLYMGPNPGQQDFPPGKRTSHGGN